MPNRLSRYCEGVIEAGWLLALVVTPLFFNIYSSRVFEPDKIALLRSLALLVIAAWLVKFVSQGGAGRRATLSREWAAAFFRQPLVVPVGALAAVYLIATLFSISPYASLYGSYQRLQGTFTTLSYLVLFAAMAVHLRQRAQVERLLTTVVVTSLPISLYGLLQHYRLDPLPWGGDTTFRVTGNMGNAIFLAAYLIMAALIVLGRVVTTFRLILTESENFARNMTRATSYVFIFAVNLVAIWFTGSRGPWLGLLAGLFFFFVLLALHWRVRWLVLSTVGLAALLAAFLVVLNIPGGPLDRLHAVPGIGRLGTVFETEGGTGRVRVLIWRGVVDLMTPHPPLQYPDGQPDLWNALRPLIGYGPEALYVAYNRFYPPELTEVEARNASPDRSHNETFDALAFTGLIGLAVYLALFVAVFYYGLKWLGLIGGPGRRKVFLALVLGGGLASAAGFVVWRGPEFFGVGLPFGMLIGLIVFLAFYALRPESEVLTQAHGASAPESWRAIALISLISAVVAHFTEIHFGIAIVSTRAHFWIFTALMFVLGFALPAAQRPTSPAKEAPALTRRRQRAAAKRTPPAVPSPTLESWRPVYISAGLMAVVLVTLGFDFVTNPLRHTRALNVLADAFTRLPSPEGGRASYAILGLVLLTWLIGGVLAYLEETEEARHRGGLSALGAGLWLAIFVAGVSWLLLSSRLAAIAAFVPTSIPELLASTGNIAGVLTAYYVELFVLVLALAAFLPAEWPAGSRAAGGVAWVWYLGLPVVALFLAAVLNLQVIQADIVYKTGLQLEEQRQPQVAIPVYERAIELAQGQDYYYLFLGRSYLNATAVLTDVTQQTSLLTAAERQLLRARELNPLNTDHSANLGRLNRQWALLLGDPAQRAERARKADEYYRQALLLSPNNAGLWNEWALLAHQLLDDPALAQAKLDQSFALDRNFEQTYQIQGDLYVLQANREADLATKQAYFEQAIAAYQQGIAVTERRGSDALNLYIGLAGAYAAANQPQAAIDAYLRVGQLGAGANQWQVYRAMAELYRQMGDVAQAHTYGQLALDIAPETERDGLQAWLNVLAAPP